MKEWTLRKHENTDDWLAAEALVASLESRSYRERQSDSKAALKRLLEAERNIDRITRQALLPPDATGGRRNGPSMDQMRLAFWVNLGLARAAPERERQKYRHTAIEIARAMIRKNPMDRRAIATYVTALTGDTTRARDAGQVKKDAEEAKAFVDAGLMLAKADRSLYLLRAQIETVLASLAEGQDRENHLTQARASFVMALSGNFIVASTSQANDLYDKIKAADFPSNAAPAAVPTEAGIRFYGDVQRATAKVLNLYPYSKVFKYIANDAAHRVIQLQSQMVVQRAAK
jgi:hypothetical protein